jgi:hypothetical protein
VGAIWQQCVWASIRNSSWHEEGEGGRAELAELQDGSHLALLQRGMHVEDRRQAGRAPSEKAS